MKISFLVTYYQQARFVAESMDSLLALEKPDDWEILIGDDGSTDGTAEAARAYVDRDPAHIRLFVMDRDPARKYNAVERASRNRLNLVRHATGDCFTLMDGDDFYSETDFIPQALRLLADHPEVSVVAFDTWRYREGDARKARKAGDPTPVVTHRGRYLRWDYTHAGACVFRRDPAPDALAAPEKIGLFDDNGITLFALNRGRMIRVRRPVYAYRQAAGESVYTAMRAQERAALNLAGLGACLAMMDRKWEDAVLARFATAVWMAWFLRNRMTEGLTPEKRETYLAACRRAGFREGEMLMGYPALEPAERRRLRKWVRRTGRLSPPRVLYAWLEVHRGRRKP